MNLIIRLIDDSDSFEDLTALLHAAYARLAAMNLRYMATGQSVDVTRDRVSKGECYVALQNNALIGTVTLMAPGAYTHNAWYARPDVAVFSQFAVWPDRQGNGVGRHMVDFLEQRAIEMGVRELACDTAEPAQHLVDWYRRLGYRIVDTAKWDHTNYRTLILSKRLTDV